MIRIILIIAVVAFLAASFSLALWFWFIVYSLWQACPHGCIATFGG